MKKSLKKIRLSFVFGIILMSVFSTLIIVNPESDTAKASIIPRFVQYDSQIELEILNPDALNEPIHPYGGLRNIKIKVKYTTTVPPIFKSGIGKNLMFGIFKFIFLAPIHLDVENIPDWMTVSLSPRDFLIDVFGEGDELERTATLQIGVNKQSTALFPATVLIKATGESPDPHIKAPPEFTYELSLTPGYVPLIDTQPDQPIKKTSPGEPVTWDIKLTNNGNGEAIVNARVINLSLIHI